MFAFYEKKKNKLFMNLIGSKPFATVLYFPCQKALTF